MESMYNLQELIHNAMILYIGNITIIIKTLQLSKIVGYVYRPLTVRFSTVGRALAIQYINTNILFKETIVGEEYLNII